MGKLEKQVEEMYSMMQEMRDKINNMDFQMVQMMQGGGAMRGPSTSTSTSKSAPVVSQVAAEIDLKPLENKLDQLMDRAANTEALTEIRDEMSKLTGGKIAKAEEMINNVSNLLEKGLQLAELGTVLDEIKDKLEELIVELSSQITSS